MTGADEAADRETDTARDHRGVLRNILKANHKTWRRKPRLALRETISAHAMSSQLSGYIVKQPRHKEPKVSLHPVRSSAVNHDIAARFLQPNNQIERGEADWKVYL